MKQNSIKAWFLAARPKTLTGAIAPVLLGGALAWKDGPAGRVLRGSQELYQNGSDSQVYLGAHYLTFAVPFVLCLLFAILMQIDANFVNDWWDFRKGTDREDRLGPERACAQGWITSKAMVVGIVITTVVALAVGCCLLLWRLQWEVLIVGLACVLGCFLYTLKLSYWGFGDLLVLVFFGVVPVGFTYYVITDSQWTMGVTLAGLGMGLITDCLLMVNNYRDVEQDRISGKRTIVVRFGKDFGSVAYIILAVAANVLMYFAANGSIYTTIVAAILIFAAYYNFQSMCHLEGKALNSLLGRTALIIFLYGLMHSVALLLVWGTVPPN